MKKKYLTIVACILLVAVLAVAFTGCNKYEWQTISGGDSNAEVISNGGYVVQQGEHIYFINGFEGTTSENAWGTIYKQGIMRANVSSDGTVDAESYVCVVPKFIYSSDSNSGFSIFGEWIYYATPNNDKDKSGVESTTNMDFMRTKIDGSITQKIYTLGARNYPYLFTPNRILYYNANEIFAIDFSGMKTNKSITNGSGAYKTSLVSAVSSYTWNADENYLSTQGKVASDYIVYTTATTDEKETYRYCNELNIINVDGSQKTTLVKFDTYTTDFKLSILDSVVENDNTVTVYYTKTKQVGSDEVKEGVFVNKISTETLAFDIATEKQLTTNDQSTVFPINYELGALVTDSTDSFIYCLNGSAGLSETYSQKVIGRTGVSVQFVEQIDSDWYVYYTNSSSANSLYRINLIEGEGESANETTVLTSGTIKLDWTKLDLIKNGDRIDFFYFDTTDYNYLHRANIAEFDGDVITSSELFGKMTDEDIETKTAAEETEE